uniref:Uncharacterized protein n=1 Tax=Arundo donax TaxID=35708 RepID=A0A0A9BB64_ARUDO
MDHHHLHLVVRAPARVRGAASGRASTRGAAPASWFHTSCVRTPCPLPLAPRRAPLGLRSRERRLPASA